MRGPHRTQAIIRAMSAYLGHLSHPLPNRPAGAVTFSFDHVRTYGDGESIEVSAAFDENGLTLSIGETRLSPPISLTAPIPLGTREIPKPWGREIWYTGIEARGVCTAGGAPLPVVLHALNLLGLAPAEPPILLKILDPFSQPVLGDLYYELHREKQEVYVVTAVDRDAWPSGTGYLRYGFRDSDTETFTADYLAAVRNYEVVRREVDALVDGMKQERGLTDPLDAETQLTLLGAIPADLSAREQVLRETMESFTALVPVHEGDVLRIARHVPHSLQHGVRVVEFQTPHYERLILSFAQKVVTQDSWDTEAALAEVTASPEPVVQPGDLRRIVSFEEFTVDRIVLQPGETEMLRVDGYALLMAIDGEASVAGTSIAAESAAYLSPLVNGADIANNGATSVTLLVAQPTS